MSTSHLISRPVQGRKCPGCREYVLVAIDGGIDIAVSPDALDIRAEAAARIKGLAIVDLEKYDGRYSYLRYRNMRRMLRPRTMPILAQHQCPGGNRPHIPWETPDPAKLPPPKPRRVNTSITVPF